MCILVVRLQRNYSSNIHCILNGGQCNTSIGQEALITTSRALYILSGFSSTQLVHKQYTASTQLVRKSELVQSY